MLLFSFTFQFSVLFLLRVDLSIYQDTSTQLANDDFLSQTDIQLTLCWDLAVATAAAITLYFHYGQTVVSILANTVESCHQTILNILLQVCCTKHQFLSLLFGL